MTSELVREKFIHYQRKQLLHPLLLMLLLFCCEYWICSTSVIVIPLACALGKYSLPQWNTLGQNYE